MRPYGELYPTVNQPVKLERKITVKEPVKRAIPSSGNWPRWALYVAKKKQPGEVGVGDTLERMFRSVGGKQFKIVTAKLGVNCRCTDRQAYFNRRFSYPQ